MLEEAGEVLENMLKASCLPLGFIVFLPAVLLLVAPPLPAADAAHEFTVYRMQQYDLQGQPYGTRNAVLNTEARTIDTDVLSRRCVLMRLLDFSYEQYQKALRQLAGAVVIILPRAMAAVPQDVIRQFMEIEPEMLAMETIVPVYFAVEDEALLSIYEQTQAASASQGSASAAEGVLGASGAEWVHGEPSLLRTGSHCATSETLNTSPVFNSAGYQALPQTCCVSLRAGGQDFAFYNPYLTPLLIFTQTKD
uniref:Nicalin n=1 Tax=Molossus molossus TaxID=27622 RepID=A0A7J8IA53_MOLMO|nr:nicalin [Molossus molossus]